MLDGDAQGSVAMRCSAQVRIKPNKTMPRLRLQCDGEGMSFPKQVGSIPADRAKCL